MDVVLKRKQNRKRKIRFSFLVLLMWFLFIWIDSFNEAIILIKNPDSIWKKTWVRFAFRELKVYLFGFMGYLYISKEKLNISFKTQFVLLLAFLDLLCLGIGLFRQFIHNFIFLENIYSNLIRLLTTPIYSICFGIYSIYFTHLENLEDKP